MRVGIDCRMINESGIGRYLRNLIKELVKKDSQNQYFLLLRKKDLKLNFADNFHKVEADYHWYGFKEQLKLPGLLNSLKLDLVHFPHFNVPMLYRGKFVVTIHDLLHQHFQMNRATTLDPLTYKIKTIAYNYVFKNALSVSERIITPTKFVKEQLMGEWDIESDKIVVTHEGVDDTIIAIARNMSTIKSKQLLQQLKIVQPYLFYVGNAHPHKQVDKLVAAFLELKKDYPELKLVLSGKRNYFWDQIDISDEGVIFTDFITDEQLVALYKNAKCFVMPSLEEGFGIPILEAFACGVAVVSSNAGALKEVGQDACLFFDKNDTQDMVSKIRRLLEDSDLVAKLIKKGEQRYNQFSWQRMAEQTLEVYKQCG